MALLPILRYPDPRLHKVAKPVAQVDARVRALVADMLETMYAADGIGLAATQVDRHERLLVIDVSHERDQPLVLINPELVWSSSEIVKRDEGCLSVPGIYDFVERPLAVKVRAQDVNGLEREIDAKDTLAVCVQHEMDHLMGRVFVQYLSALKQGRIKSKLQKQLRDER